MNRARAAICVLLLCTSASLAQTPPTPTPTPAPAPTPPPAPRFTGGGPLDDLRNRAWDKMEEMTDAYEQCDAERYERALKELEQLRKDARAAAAAARGAGEFRTVSPEEADSLANSLADMVRQYAGALAGLRRECTRGHRPGGIGTILGPRRQPQTATGTPPPAQGQIGGTTTTQPPPNPQPPNCNPPPAPPPTTQPPPEPAESILDEIEEMERWERDRKKAERDKRQASGQGAQTTPAQGLSQAEQAALARQMDTIASFEAALAELKELVRQGRMNEAWDLIDELDEWLDYLSGPPRVGPLLGQPGTRLPKELLDKWDAAIEDIIDNFPPGLPGLKLGTISANILDLHNKTRAEAGVAPLRWDPYLACQAISYGPKLAQYDRPVHSPRTGRETSRENLLQALPGTSPAAMMNVWISERRHFRPGIFPDVSSTGNWADVGHYTQMVWPKTTAVGCGVQRGIGRFDWLICRYSPPGNKDGTAMGLPPPGGPVIAQDGGIAAPDSSTPVMPRGRWRPPVGGGMTQIDPPANPPPPPPPAPQTRSVLDEIEESDRYIEEQRRAGSGPSTTTPPPAPQPTTTPPPPPRPNATDEAPGADESRHPLVDMADAAAARFDAAHRACNMEAMLAAVRDLEYAISEMHKRLRAARAAGQFSGVNPADIEANLTRAEEQLRNMKQRISRCPPRPLHQPFL